MAFNWGEYLNLAQFLETNGNYFSQVIQEAAYRSTVSRAYYAAFCYAREYVCNNYGFTPTNTGRDHKLVRDKLYNIGSNHIANRLRVLHRWRKQCDYDNRVNHVSDMAKNAIKEALIIFNDL